MTIFSRLINYSVLRFTSLIRSDFLGMVAVEENCDYAAKLAFAVGKYPRQGGVLIVKT